MKKAVLMARVSSDEQAKGYSLGIQIEKLQNHCSRQNITIINSIREDYSAKNFNRPEFRKFLDFIRINKGKVDLLLITTWDRFSRNLSESFAMIDRLKDYGIEVQAIEQPLDLSIPENLMILAVYLAMPDIDNKRRSIKIKEGVRAATACGRWLGKAPFGYSNKRDETNKPIIVPNENAGVIQEIFQGYTNCIPLSEIRGELRKKGIVISKSRLSEIIKNQAYIGKVFLRSESNPSRESIQGLHKPIISTELFNKAQDILTGKNAKKGKWYYKPLRTQLFLRGHLECPKCGNPLTGSGSKSKTGTKHYYYHCNHCHCFRIRADKSHHILEKIFDQFAFSTPIKKLYNRIIEQSVKQKSLVKKRLPEQIDKEIELNRQRVENLGDQFSDVNLMLKSLIN